MPSASIIVVSYNGRAWLEKCLGAAAAQLTPADELIVVDNGSSDDSVEFLRRVHPTVRVVPLTSNTGFAAGNNAGARAARGELLAFLNNDAAPERGWLSALRQALEADSRAAIAASRIMYMHDPNIVDSAGDGLLRWGGAFKRAHGASPADAPEVLRGGEVFGACGAACLVRRDVFEEIGGFDEAFFAVYEDVDLAYRVRLRGHTCVYVPQAVVLHAGSATLGHLSRRSVYWGQRNLEWVYFKNTPAQLLAATFPGHVIYLLAAAVFFTRSGQLGAFLSAKRDALGGLPRVWSERRTIQARRRVPASRIWRVMDGGWIGRKLREKRFDIGRAPATTK
jgi:GT2 family glycosyltransferase